MSRTEEPALPPDAFAAKLREEGSTRYHDRHPFHVRMHEGSLSREQLQHWVENRYYYQTRLPMKDALILAKSDDPEFRRRWMQRIQEQDGTGTGEDGGLALWLRLAAGVGLDPDDVASCWNVLPGVREACDEYVEFVRTATLVEGVAASLTECFAPALMAARLEAWQRHYAWVPREALAYFERRVERARADGEHALSFVVSEARTRRVQDRCLAALIRKTELLGALLDALSDAYLNEQPRRAAGGRR
jgi:pyrroloquinoline-quinone synthase